MAPRVRRPRKLTPRAEAAIEHMTTFGFERDRICTVLRELVLLYGEDQWLFIEADSYKVLIDALLDTSEQEEQPENGNCNENGHIEGTDDSGPYNPHLQSSSSAVIEAIAQHDDPEDNQARQGGMRALSIHDNAPTNNFSPPSPVARPHVRRRPCYGWIAADDEAEAEIINLPPDLGAFYSSKKTEHEVKRRTRWDMAPGSM